MCVFQESFEVGLDIETLRRDLHMILDDLHRVRAATVAAAAAAADAATVAAGAAAAAGSAGGGGACCWFCEGSP